MGNLLQSQAPEEAQLDHPALAGVEGIERTQGVVYCHDVGTRHRGRQSFCVGEGYPQPLTLAAKAPPPSGHVHQHPAHDLGGHCIEMRPILPPGTLPGSQAEVGLVDERGGLEQVSGAFTPHLPDGHAVELALDQWRECFERAFIALGPREEQLGQLCLVGDRQDGSPRRTRRALESGRHLRFMTPERWHAVEQVYHSARRLSGASRMDYLAEVGARDPELRDEVDSLLSHADAPSPLTAALPPVAETAAWLDAASVVGTDVGTYRIESWLETGGMGVLFVARDTTLDRQIALKVLPPALLEDGERLLRFEREARALARLNHPNIATIHGVVDSGRIRAIVMELVEGDTLARIIETAPGRHLPVERALRIADQLADALETAHAHGVIHRDLKPANIMVTGGGIVKVLDFGLARVSDPSSANDDLSGPTPTPNQETRVGAVLGTAGYMSPEQARGLAIDKRADIWAFGCVLHEMLTGAVPPLNTTHLDALPTDAPDVVRRLLHRCLEPDPRHRLRDIGDARLDIADALKAGEGPTHPNLAALPSVRRRFPWRAGLAAIGAAVIGGLVVWLGLGRSPESPQTSSRFIVATNEALPLLTSPWGDTALTPDGSLLAFRTVQGMVLRARDGRPDIVLPVERGAHHPFFSPDGQWLAYGLGPTLRKIPVTGGTSVFVTDTRAWAVGSWTDDGILFADAEGLFRVDPDGGVPTRLRMEALEGNERVAYPAALPGTSSALVTVISSRLSFVPTGGTADAPGARVDVVDLRTGARRTLVRGGGAARYVPTGHIVYLSSGRLHAVAFDLRRQETQGPPVQVLAHSGITDFTTSQEGSLAFTSGGISADNGELVWVDRQGRIEPVGAPLRPYVYPRLSPDRSRIGVIVREPLRGGRDVWIWDLQRRTFEPLTGDGSDNSTLAWSLDGRNLAFGAARPERVINTFWQSADGTGTPKALAPSPGIQMPITTAPDGRLLLSVDVPGEGRNIFTIDPITPGQPLPLFGGPANELTAEVSPNGRWIAYDSDESGQFEVYVRPYPDVHRRRWAVSAGGGRQPLWSRNGGELFYRDFTGALIAVRVDDGPDLVLGQATRLLGGAGFAGDGPGGSARTYDLSPDGTRFLMIRRFRPPSPALTMIVNWFPELTRVVARGGQ